MYEIFCGCNATFALLLTKFSQQSPKIYRTVTLINFKKYISFKNEYVIYHYIYMLMSMLKILCFIILAENI